VRLYVGAEYESLIYLLSGANVMFDMAKSCQCAYRESERAESEFDIWLGGVMRPGTWVQSLAETMNDGAWTLAHNGETHDLRKSTLPHIAPRPPPSTHSGAAHASRVLFAAETDHLSPLAACPHPRASHAFINGAR
jgi:hypothetical protein